MSFAASIVGDTDAADDERVTGLEPVEVEAVANSEGQRLGRPGGGRLSLGFHYNVRRRREPSSGQRRAEKERSGRARGERRKGVWFCGVELFWDWNRRGEIEGSGGHRHYSLIAEK